MIMAFTTRLAKTQPKPHTWTCHGFRDSLAIILACSELIERENDELALAARLIRGEALLEVGEYENALVDFDKVIEDWDKIDPHLLFD